MSHPMAPASNLRFWAFVEPLVGMSSALVARQSSSVGKNRLPGGPPVVIGRSFGSPLMTQALSHAWSAVQAHPRGHASLRRCQSIGTPAALRAVR